MREKKIFLLYFFSFHRKSLVVAQPGAQRLRTARCQDVSVLLSLLQFLSNVQEMSVRVWPKLANQGIWRGNLSASLACSLWKGRSEGRMTHSSLGLLILRVELLWAGRGCGTPGALQGFMTPFHVILQLSNPWKKYAGRAGGKGILCFLTCMFSCTLFKCMHL